MQRNKESFINTFLVTHLRITTTAKCNFDNTFSRQCTCSLKKFQNSSRNFLFRCANFQSHNLRRLSKILGYIQPRTAFCMLYVRH